MRPVHWLVALIVVSALAWWTFGHPGYETAEQRAARVEVESQADEPGKPGEPGATAPPTLYRWRDDSGVLQVTDRPPKGRKYETVDMGKHENVNVIPMADAIDPPDPAADDKSKRK